MSERLFTPDEANAAIDDLRPRLERIKAARTVVIEHGELVRERVAGDGGGTEGSAFYEAITTLRREVEHLAAEGVLLRDPENGLVDFPAEVQGRAGFLCWRSDEQRVGFWHPPESGYRGRRPL
ncbi:MAG: DUF2203 domain-containing protein [Actinomycetota bacterium]